MPKATQKNSTNIPKAGLEILLPSLLTIDIAYVDENKTHALLSVRVPREVIARNIFLLNCLSESAGDFDITPAPLPKRRNLGKELLKVPFGYIGANDEFVVFSVRIALKSLARHHGILPVIAAIGAGATPWVEAA